MDLVKRYTFRDRDGRVRDVKFRTELPPFSLTYASMTITKLQYESLGESNTAEQTHQTSEGNTRTPLARIGCESVI